MDTITMTALCAAAASLVVAHKVKSLTATALWVALIVIISMGVMRRLPIP